MDMAVENPKSARGQRSLVWAGWLVALAPLFMILTSARWKLTEDPWYVREFERIGWDPSALPLLASLQLTAIVLYLIPSTAVFGATLLTGYLGGAVASYVRIGEFYPPVVPFTTAALAWFGLWLREPRLRTLLPFRRTVSLPKPGVLPMLLFGIAAVVTGCESPSHAQGTGSTPLDAQVRAFLERHRGTWRDLNVPESDGRLLYDLVLKRGFRRALEIGTSTGHSGIWIAWALSKTGGTLTTIEIDPRRHREAVANFKEAGLLPHVDARLGNAHELVPKLEGPFDFVFSDADKEWYTRYFIALWPKIQPGGCFTAHNVRSRRQRGIGEFLEHLETVRDGVTTIDTSSSAGVSITCKRSS